MRLLFVVVAAVHVGGGWIGRIGLVHQCWWCWHVVGMMVVVRAEHGARVLLLRRWLVVVVAVVPSARSGVGRTSARSIGELRRQQCG